MCFLSDGNALQEKKALLQGTDKVRNLHSVFTGTAWDSYSELWGFRKRWAQEKRVRNGEKVIKMNPRLLGGAGWKWCSKGQQEIFHPAYCWLREASTGGILTPMISLKSAFVPQPSPLHPEAVHHENENCGPQNWHKCTKMSEVENKLNKRI